MRVDKSHKSMVSMVSWCVSGWGTYLFVWLYEADLVDLHVAVRVISTMMCCWNTTHRINSSILFLFWWNLLHILKTEVCANHHRGQSIVVEVLPWFVNVIGIYILYITYYLLHIPDYILLLSCYDLIDRDVNYVRIELASCDTIGTLPVYHGC